jgi:hypothetical protein
MKKLMFGILCALCFSFPSDAQELKSKLYSTSSAKFISSNEITHAKLWLFLIRKPKISKMHIVKLTFHEIFGIDLEVGLVFENTAAAEHRLVLFFLKVLPLVSHRSVSGIVSFDFLGSGYFLCGLSI